MGLERQKSLPWSINVGTHVNYWERQGKWSDHPHLDQRAEEHQEGSLVRVPEQPVGCCRDFRDNHQTKTRTRKDIPSSGPAYLELLYIWVGEPHRQISIKIVCPRTCGKKDHSSDRTSVTDEFEKEILHKEAWTQPDLGRATFDVRCISSISTPAHSIQSVTA